MCLDSKNGSISSLFRIEQFSGQDNVSCHLDLLLGRGWDVRGMGGGEPSGEHSQGYRVILTLELAVDLKQQLRYVTYSLFVCMQWQLFCSVIERLWSKIKVLNGT